MAVDDGPDLESTDPIDVREAYSQGMRAGVQMLRGCLPDLYASGYESFAGGLERLLLIADRKINTWAEDNLFP